MNRNVGARRTLLVSFAAAALLLSGCSADPGADPGPTAEATAEPTEEPTVEPSAEPTTEPTSVDCLEDGPWYDDATARYEALSHDLAANGELHSLTTSGDLTYAFDGATMTVTYANWLMDASLYDTRIGEVTLRHAENGPTTAPYTATEAEITALGADVSALTVEYVATGGISGASNEQMVEGMKNLISQPVSWSYTCTADELILTPIVDEGVTAVPVVLHHR